MWLLSGMFLSRQYFFFPGVYIQTLLCVQSTPATNQNGTAEGGSSAAVANEEAAEGVQPPNKKPKTEVTLCACYRPGQHGRMKPTCCPALRHCVANPA